MRALQKTAAGVLAIALVATLYGIWATYQPPPPELGKQESATRPAGTDATAIIDERTLRRAQRLSSLASTPEELPFAQSATQLADHELDVAFAAALRQIEAHPPVLSPEAQKVADRLQTAQKQLDSDQARVNQLTAALAQPGAAQNSALQDRLNLAQSQFELDKDEVATANQDLMLAGGNAHQRIQKMMQDHAAAANHHPPPKSTAGDPLAKLHGLVEQFREWQTLRKKERFLQHAATQATNSAAALRDERQKLAAQLEESKKNAPARPAAAAATTPAASAPTTPTAPPDAAVEPTSSLLATTR